MEVLNGAPWELLNHRHTPPYYSQGVGAFQFPLIIRVKHLSQYHNPILFFFHNPILCLMICWHKLPNEVGSKLSFQFCGSSLGLLEETSLYGNQNV